MRTSGILLPVSALCGGYGMGAFDCEAYAFVDALRAAKQSYWQILPLGPTGYGDSPYAAFSTFAGSPYYVSLDEMVAQGWLTHSDLPPRDLHAQEVDYLYMYLERFKLLRKAHANSNIASKPEFQAFCAQQEWLHDYALFMAIKDSYDGVAWNHWDEALRRRDPQALAAKERELATQVEFYKFVQFCFFQQWNALRGYANSRGIKIIGDIPIYVAYDSADTWANQDLFQLDADGLPVAVAGVPPDGFSADGQLWGNPLYRWSRHKETGYAWWVKRMQACEQMFDCVRIDHFRGFESFFCVPYGELTARNGYWEQGPGYDLFATLDKAVTQLDIIAEDLGFLTDGVRELLAQTGYPGMKIFEFAFDARDTSGANFYLPHNYHTNCVVYTGTHDNETLMGWFKSITPEERQALRDYLSTDSNNNSVLCDKSITACLQSVADRCIIPMQDWLELDNRARFNTPSTLGGNWMWRMPRGCFTTELVDRIAKKTRLYGRDVA